MAKMTLEELRKLRSSQKSEMERRDTDGKEIHIIVGMGTCGIAAGAKDALDGFLDTIKINNLNDVVVKQTGCMGLCYSEPTVEVKVPGMPNVIYGNVDAAVAKSIVEQHIMHKKMVQDHIQDKPAGDIIK
ncbi:MULTISPECIES: ferredoxin [unclassified Oceanispirochaeta]|uniref:(2Fe-2S) ferredoxin domain-containing protein n=1 Tax=unclassified Oceanispirochaeta TaxID=2635722 RepID=UPI000E08EDB6|nr:MULTISPECIES: (2Fe-2S) ferredoxin domain-containing protein [unclassified Oceanispirochaeta]MBF9015461.1 (2Fe-2S) ferredoxin domain-containing protein [Oceanispirochaeta sp. M2]NPD71920.1 (2Fe-2S) ferredoxin domain-containing protein [Oceanispirochaeta sp. M1]RDG32728.1 (2Fe-2S) ferredoxin domain-containing protein [Oceanispirochaeta sp. M1]